MAAVPARLEGRQIVRQDIPRLSVGEHDVTISHHRPGALGQPVRQRHGHACTSMKAVDTKRLDPDGVQELHYRRSEIVHTRFGDAQRIGQAIARRIRSNYGEASGPGLDQGDEIPRRLGRLMQHE